MKIGISSWTYSWGIGVAGYARPQSPISAMDLLKKAHELDVQVLQIADNLPLEHLCDAQLDALYHQALAWDIALEVGTRGVQPQHLLAFFGIAQRLHSPLVRTLLHDDDGCPTLEQAEARIRAVLPALHERNLTLAIENHDFFSVEALRTLMERINDEHVGICLDPVNNLAQGESTNDVFSALGEHTVNFHCKDYTIRRKPTNLGFDVEGCPAGDGLLNLPRCAKLLSGRDASFVLELWTPWQDGIEATCALEGAWAQRSIAALKLLQQQ